MSIQLLVSKQNRDGGWPYVQGTSRTEPTAYAILALLAAGELESARRGVSWLRKTRLPDGGWPPQPGIDESTWVTALVALIPVEHLGERPHADAIRWLVGTMGHESTLMYRARVWLLGGEPYPEHEFPGWPWIPGAAAWVGPTSLAVMALEKELARKPSAEIKRRVEEGRRFLLRRVCVSGGWNHGSVRALGYESTPYPETTGMGLAALRGVHTPEVEQTIAVAEQFLAECRSADALNWLRLGLLAQGRLPEGWCPQNQPACRTLSETSLDLLLAGAHKGANSLWA